MLTIQLKILDETQIHHPLLAILSGQQMTNSASGRVRDVKPGDLDYKSNALPTRLHCLPLEMFLSSLFQ